MNPSLKFAISGASGLIGSTVFKHFQKKGHSIFRLARPQSKNRKAEDILFDPDHQKVDLTRLEGHDVVIHLAGASIAGGRWTEKYKKTILESRVNSTKLLAECLTKLKNPPALFLCASAIGYYGSHPRPLQVDEMSGSGTDFLSEVCRLWEEAAWPAKQAGIRTVHTRFGMVLGKAGGALGKMLPVFKAGLGGPIGSGEQVISWISVEEIPYMIEHLIAKKDIIGAVNAVTPLPVTNYEFTKTLGKTLHRPTVFPLPAFAAKLLFGQMADELLLSSSHVVPRALVRSGYEFGYGDLASALNHLFETKG